MKIQIKGVKKKMELKGLALGDCLIEVSVKRDLDFSLFVALYVIIWVECLCITLDHLGVLSSSISKAVNHVNIQQWSSEIFMYHWFVHVHLVWC